jgi:ribosomal protein L37AE/L43A
LRQRGDITQCGRPKKVKEVKEVVCEKCEESIDGTNVTPVVNTEVTAWRYNYT